MNSDIVVFVCLCIACSEDEFQCKNTGRCILAVRVCDGYNTCGDWSDEENCREGAVNVNLHYSYLIVFDDLQLFLFIFVKATHRVGLFRKNTDTMTSFL